MSSLSAVEFKTRISEHKKRVTAKMDEFLDILSFLHNKYALEPIIIQFHNEKKCSAFRLTSWTTKNNHVAAVFNGAPNNKLLSKFYLVKAFHVQDRHKFLSIWRTLYLVCLEDN